MLLYGMLDAIVMRTVLIHAEALLLAQFHWLLYIFGLFLLLIGVNMLVFAKQEPDLEKNPVMRWMRSHMKITNEYHGERFFVLKEGVCSMTPMYVVLVLGLTSSLR